MIEAKQSRNHKGRDGNNTENTEAAYNVKTAADGKRKTTYGYKMHVNTDEDGFVKKMTYIPSNVHDSQKFDQLLDRGKSQDKLKICSEVYADSAYANKKNDEKLGKQNNKVLHRAYRNKPLTNKSKATSGAHPFVILFNTPYGMLKLHQSLGKARYFGLERNKTRA